MPATIDLRSDTVTRPTVAMREAMAAAEVGDDVFGDDPTVQRLEELAAGMLGKEAGAFVTSGTQSNLCALLVHCARGDEYLVGQEAHCYLFEGGGGATLASVQPQTVRQRADGTLDLAELAALVKPDDFHYARTRLLCLENTTWGKVLPVSYLAGARGFADRHGLAMHLDGARIFNAAAAGGTAAAEIAAPFDSVSVCLSKGLGAPVGSVLLGRRDFIREAKRWRKMLGGGLRQSGLLAAAGIHALEHHVGRLAEDHANAKRLARGLADLGVDCDPVQTNMVFAHLDAPQIAGFVEHARARGVLVAGYAGDPVRMVTHLDVDAGGVDRALGVFATFLGA